jgi:hypothetical protein
METLSVLNLVQVDTLQYLTKQFDVPVVCQVGPGEYVKHVKGRKFDFGDFVKNPGDYVSDFGKFIPETDILITGHFWDPESPVFFTLADMQSPDFRISVIADITCDVNGSVPSTVRASTIADPFYGFNPKTGREEPAFSRQGNVTVMAVDNLPGELPRDASQDFGKQLMQNVLHELFTNPDSTIIKQATITSKGNLTESFKYLDEYAS